MYHLHIIIMAPHSVTDTGPSMLHKQNVSSRSIAVDFETFNCFKDTLFRCSRRKLKFAQFVAVMDIGGIFFRGGKVIFPDFFPVENSPFGEPKTNFSGFEK